MKRLLMWVAGAFVLMVVLAGVFGTDGAPKTHAASHPTHATQKPSPVSSLAPSPATVTPPPDQNLAGPQTAFDDGTYLVGTDIQLGTYKSDGTGPCYWARLSDTSGSLDAIITNHAGDGPAVVTIAASDAAFQSQGCGTWVQTVP